MAMPDDYSSVPVFAVSWQPLEELARQWGQFGAEVGNVAALHATGAAFLALAREVEAREYHIEARRKPHFVDLVDLESALDGLSQAREQWTSTLTVLELLVNDKCVDEIIRRRAQDLVTQAMQQRLHLSVLMQGVEQEQFAVRHRDQ